MMAIAACVAGFALGCGCSVALLFCLKPAAERAEIRETTQNRQVPEGPEGAAPEGPAGPMVGGPTIEQQYENFFAFDGRKQPGKDVSDNED